MYDENIILVAVKMAQNITNTTQYKLRKFFIHLKSITPHKRRIFVTSTEYTSGAVERFYGFVRTSWCWLLWLFFCQKSWKCTLKLIVSID